MLWLGEVFLDPNLMKHDDWQTETALKMRSADGTVYFITSKNPVEYLLHPEFLRFVIIICVFYGLLRGDEDVKGLTGWPFVAIWSLVFTVVLVWLALCGYLLLLLLKSRRIGQIWTPLLLFPLNLMIESSVQFTMHWLVDQPFKPWGVTLSDLTRDFIILLLADLLHGHYVVARHPHALIPNLHSSAERSRHAFDLAPTATDKAASFAPQTDVSAEQDDQVALQQTVSFPSVVAASPQTVVQPSTVRIGTEIFTLTDILMIRIEDHYLSITTRSGKSMQRAKLGGIEALHKGDIGIQINRSVWVAFSAIREVHPEKNGQILLLLSNGQEELVAKPRVHAFRQAYRATAT
jgi:hypothetical protein